MSKILSKGMLGAVSGAIFTLALASNASAALVSIGFQEAGVNSGNITTEGSGTNFASVNNLNYGTFASNTVSATSTPLLPSPGILNSTSMDINSNLERSHTLTIYVTSQGLTSPLGVSSFLSSFTENALDPGFTVTMATYIDSANGKYTTTTPLSSASFTNIGTSVQGASGNAVPDLSPLRKCTLSLRRSG